MFHRNQHPIPNSAYGPSKAALHWITKRINAEEESLLSFVFDPGWSNTDMGINGAKLLGFERAPVEPSDSCDGLINVLSGATKETHGGQFILYTGEIQAW